MKWIITYTVEGFGHFPIDMLRYDRSFPASEMESGKIVKSFLEASRWTVTLCMYGRTSATQPEYGRWHSFGCKIHGVESRKL